MIVAFSGIDSRTVTALLSVNLAVLRARSGRKTCLVDADPGEPAYGWSCARRFARQWPTIPGRAAASHVLAHEIGALGPDYQDLLINAGSHDGQGTLPALIAARVVVVPVTVDQVDIDRDYPLIARLNAARMFNPGLRVLFVVVTDGPTPADNKLAAVRPYVAHVMSATLSGTVLHLHRDREYGRGRCVCDAETCDPDTAGELHALYREVYAH